ncbi:CHZ1 family protein [Abortiporus biennis]
MSTGATTPATAQTEANNVHDSNGVDASTIANKGKGKQVEEVMEEDDDDDDEEEEEEDEDDEMEEDNLEEIDASAILPTSRRTRGVRVDYTSAEALAKAGLKPENLEEEEAEESFVAQDDEMKDD